MSFIGELLLLALDIYMFIIIVQVVISWLIAFEVLNVRNEQAANLIKLLAKATDPVYKPIRKFIPPISGMDISPIVVIIAIMFLQRAVAELFIF